MYAALSYELKACSHTTHMHECTYVFMYTYIHTYTYMYTNTCTHAHTHMHTSIYPVLYLHMSYCALTIVSRKASRDCLLQERSKSCEDSQLPVLPRISLTQDTHCCLVCVLHQPREGQEVEGHRVPIQRLLLVFLRTAA